MEEIFGISENIGADTFALKIEQVTYEKAINELKGVGESLSFGDDLSDTALRKLGDLHKGFYFITDWPMKYSSLSISMRKKNTRSYLVHLIFSMDTSNLFQEVEGSMIPRS